jgi:hypothetical protein
MKKASDTQCARDLLAGFVHTQPPVDSMVDQIANHIAAHRIRETDPLRSSLNRVTGSLGLIINGARADAPGHKANYEHARKVLDADQE